MARRWAPGTVARSRFKASTIESVEGDEKVLLMHPTYVNRTGESVAEAVRFFKLTPADDLLVIVDDVALPCGTIRLREEAARVGTTG